MITLLDYIEMSRILEKWQEDINSDTFAAVHYKSEIKSKLKDAKAAVDDYVTSMEGFF